MILNKIGYSYNDLTIIPKEFSLVNTRAEIDTFINNNLPIFTAPMASVVSDNNYKAFIKNNIIPIIPRNISLNIRKDLMKNEIWITLSLKEFQELFINNANNNLNNKTYYICIDIANGHMQKLYLMCKDAKLLAKQYNYNIIIMTGNIANPETYRTICYECIYSDFKIIDYIRCGIGGGSVCITSSNTSIHYPQASLINDCFEIKKSLLSDTSNFSKNKLELIPKIIADGGIRNYSDVIKALALGADYVMIGSLFAQCLESSGEKYINEYNKNFNEIKDNYKIFIYKNNNWYGYYTDLKMEEELSGIFSDSKDTIYNKLKRLQEIGKIYVKFFGMASADGQKSIDGKKTKTAEGITKYLPVKYTLNQWSENMIAYLRSAMSYCNCFNLKEFIGNQILIVNSISEINAVNK